MLRVSVIVAVYNGAATVRRAIASVLEQKFDGLEVLVVDDGSTDPTAEVLQSWGTHIRVVRQKNRGPSVARNVAARLAQGAYLAFLDADDVWLPDKLSKVVSALDSAPDAVLAYSNFKPVDDYGREVPETFFTADCDHAPSMEELLSRWWPITTSTVVMRRATFERCGGFSEQFRSAGYEDPYLWLLAREQGKFVFVNEPLVLYRTEPVVERMEKYKPGCATFVRLVRQRYGAAGATLNREIVHAQVTSLGYKGLLAMRRGDVRFARRAFLLALRYEPLHLRHALRFLRTYLPPGAARALTGRTRMESGSAEDDSRAC